VNTPIFSWTTEPEQYRLSRVSWASAQISCFTLVLTADICDLDIFAVNKFLFLTIKVMIIMTAVYSLFNLAIQQS